MYTAILSLTTAIITAVGMAFYGFPANLSGLALVVAIAVGAVIDHVRGLRAMPTMPNGSQ
jgi:hypothetical protein